MNTKLFNRIFRKKISKPKIYLLMVVVLLMLGYNAKSGLAQTSPSVLFVPLIGISSVPDPLTLPNGPGVVTYHYAVKNFIDEVPLTNVQVSDDTCSPVKFVEGDDNHDNKLDAGETWRYTCTIKLSQTTQSIATAQATANGITAIHKAYTTVVVGSNIPAPLVSIVNISKVAYPLSLPAGGGQTTFTYKVNNPGTTPLSDVVVTDDKCSPMSGRLGDTNGNNLLDPNEVWIYTCTTKLTQTTTNTAIVTAYANGLKAYGDIAITVNVKNSPNVAQAQVIPKLPTAGSKPQTLVSPSLKLIVWTCLLIVLAVLTIYFLKSQSKRKNILVRLKK